MNKPDPIVCSSGCKREVPDEKAALLAGWENLPINGRWRCPLCWLQLRAVNHRPEITDSI